MIDFILSDLGHFKIRENKFCHWEVVPTKFVFKKTDGGIGDLFPNLFEQGLFY